jgi:hypothetical protein
MRSCPAFSFTAPPPDAPDETWISGRFTAGMVPVNTPQSLEQNGLMRPFFGQPLQGFSAYAFTRDPDGAIYALIDNGFGSKANSSDALLELYAAGRGFRDRRGRPCRSASGCATPTASCPSASCMRRPRRAT